MAFGPFFGTAFGTTWSVFAVNRQEVTNTPLASSAGVEPIPKPWIWCRRIVNSFDGLAASEMYPRDLDEWWAKAKEKALTPYSMLKIGNVEIEGHAKR
ncbi:hypothetical protein N9Y61_04160 [Paracoccaceae bacterium]|nr:hypothetical protein [Paracoccaceae bacterium]